MVVFKVEMVGPDFLC